MLFDNFRPNQNQLAMKYSITLFAVGIILASCTNMNKTGENTTPEGTVVDSRTNADMEDDRTMGGDSVRSPGSNSQDIEKNGKGNLNGSNDNSTPVK